MPNVFQFSELTIGVFQYQNEHVYIEGRFDKIMDISEELEPVYALPGHPQQESSIPTNAAAYSRRAGMLAHYSTPIAVFADAVCIALGSLLSLVVYHQFIREPVTAAFLFRVCRFAIEYWVAFVLFSRLNFLYSHEHTLLQIKDTARILRVSTFSFLLLTIDFFFSRVTIPRALFVLSWVAITLLILYQKHATRARFAKSRAQLVKSGNALIIGSGSEARRLFSFLLNSPSLQMQPVGFLQDTILENDEVVYSHDYRFKDSAPVFTGQVNAELITRLALTDIFVAEPLLSQQQTSELAGICATHGTTLSFVASAQPHYSGNPTHFRVLDGLFVSSFSPEINSCASYELLKRLLDVSIASLAILVSLPVWGMIAVWIRSTSEGPIFFRQGRVGADGKLFEMLKFRSMYIHAPKYGRSPEDTHDPRITRAGRFLRKTSLDELPQLWNVLAGNMSLVGPRPEMPYIVEKYTSFQRQRLSVQQGLTGIWQLSADRKNAIHRSVEYDLYYIQNRGLFMDLAILLHTVVFAMKGI